MIHHHLHHSFQTSAVAHRVKNPLLYERLLHFHFEEAFCSSARAIILVDVLCSSVWGTGFVLCSSVWGTVFLWMRIPLKAVVS